MNELAVTYFKLAKSVAEDVIKQDMRISEREEHIKDVYNECTKIHQIASAKHFRTKVIADIYEVEIQQ